MSSHVPQPRLTAVAPTHACPGGLVRVHGTDLYAAGGSLPTVQVGGRPVRLAAVSPTMVAFRVDADSEPGTLEIHVDGAPTALTLDVGAALATGVHQVDSPVIDDHGRVYATYSGARGEHVPVSIFRVTPGGARESFSSSVQNPTSMTFGPDGALYVSSRFEGTVSRVDEDGMSEVVVSDVGVACGLTFDRDGALYIGDRSGTIFRARVESGEATSIATLPPSVVAFHLAMSPDGWLYVTAPTLTSNDRVYRVHPADGRVEIVAIGLGRPQGLALDGSGALFVADALAGASGLYRVGADAPPELVVAGEVLVGVAFDAGRGLVVASNDTIFRFDRAPGRAAA